MALLKEDSQDYERADSLWQRAFQLLANEVEDDTGAGASTPVQVVDSFLTNLQSNSWDNAYGGNYPGFYGR